VVMGGALIPLGRDPGSGRGPQPEAGIVGRHGRTA